MQEYELSMAEAGVVELARDIAELKRIMGIVQDNSAAPPAASTAQATVTLTKKERVAAAARTIAQLKVQVKAMQVRLRCSCETQGCMGSMGCLYALLARL